MNQHLRRWMCINSRDDAIVSQRVVYEAIG